MNLGVDLDHTLSANPEFYKWLMVQWKQSRGFVYIITGRSPLDATITQAELKQWGIEKGVHYDCVHMYPEDYFYSRHIDGGAYLDKLGNKLEKEQMRFKIGAWKARKCEDLKIDTFFDDDPIFVTEMRKNGIYVMHVDGEYQAK